jgi:hypothetical protein
MNDEKAADSDILDRIAPCGLDCGKCLAYEGGAIQQHSQALLDLLGPNFEGYASRFARMEPVFENYPQFNVLLTYLARGACQGCRKGGCLFKTCRVHSCVKEKGVEFCFQCPDFPCREINFPPPLEEVWFKNNQRMRELGLEAYYERIKDRKRYP